MPPGWSKTGLEKKFSLLDLEEATGHTLIHYLFTKTYETLYTEANSSKHEACIGLKRALLVYIMTEKYDLPNNLQQLATREMEEHGSRLNVFETLEAFKDHFSKLDSKSWVHNYLSKKAKAAFEENHTVFKTKAFMESADDAGLNKFMMGCVIDLYDDKISHMIDLEKEMFHKVDQQDRMVRGEPVGNIVLEQNMEVQQDFIAPQIDEPTVDECCGHFEQDEMSTDGFCTMSCPSPGYAVDVSLQEATTIEQCFASDFSVPEDSIAADVNAYEKEAAECKRNDTADREVVSKQEEDAVAAAVEPDPGFVPAADPFAGLSRVRRKKLEKKMKQEAIAKDREDERLRFEVEEAELKRVEKDIAEAEARWLEEARIEVELPSSSEPWPAELSKQPCAQRSQHLVNGNEWMECEQCRAFLQQVAEQFVLENIHGQDTK